MSIRYLAAFICAFIIVLILTPKMANIAKKINFIDVPNKRKIHKNPVPQLGSISIFIGFTISYLTFTNKWDFQTICIIISSLLIIGIGIIDDWYKTKGLDFPAWPKLIFQIGAAILVYFSGIVFKGFNNPISKNYIVLPICLQFLFSIVWIFGVTTVINFIDGIDALAASICSISSITLFIVALVKNQNDSALMSIILVAICLGYLQYNKPPARIYMGDAGSTFLGFILGIVSLNGAFKQATLLSLLIPFFALGIPIIDNIFVVINRFLKGYPIYKADRSQIHYRLLSKGLTPNQVVIFLSLASTCLSLIAIIILILT